MTTSEITTGNDRPHTGGTPSIHTFDGPQPTPPADHYSHIATHRGVAYISGQLPVTPDDSPQLHHESAVEVHAVAALD